MNADILRNNELAPMPPADIIPRCIYIRIIHEARYIFFFSQGGRQTGRSEGKVFLKVVADRIRSCWPISLPRGARSGFFLYSLSFVFPSSRSLSDAFYGRVCVCVWLLGKLEGRIFLWAIVVLWKVARDYCFIVGI